VLFDSPHIHIEPYLHQLMPSILTCVVGRRLSEHSSEDHWELRDFAASLVAHVCQTFGRSYATLQPRVTKTLLQAFLEPNKPLPTHYGGIRALAALGPQSIGLFIVPNCATYVRTVLQKELRSEDPQRQRDAGKVRGALLDAVGTYLRHSTEEARAGFQQQQQQQQQETESGGSNAEALRALLSKVILSTSIDVQRAYQEMRELFGAELDDYLQRHEKPSLPHS